MFINGGELEIYDIMHAPETFAAFELDSKLILFVSEKQDDNPRRLIALFRDSAAMAGRRTLIMTITCSSRLIESSLSLCPARKKQPEN
jgi:hypothetical protein